MPQNHIATFTKAFSSSPTFIIQSFPEGFEAMSHRSLSNYDYYSSDPSPVNHRRPQYLDLDPRSSFCRFYRCQICNELLEGHEVCATISSSEPIDRVLHHSKAHGGISCDNVCCGWCRYKRGKDGSAFHKVCLEEINDLVSKDKWNILRLVKNIKKNREYGSSSGPCKEVAKKWEELAGRLPKGHTIRCIVEKLPAELRLDIIEMLDSSVVGDTAVLDAVLQERRGSTLECVIQLFQRLGKNEKP